MDWEVETWELWQHIRDIFLELIYRSSNFVSDSTTRPVQISPEAEGFVMWLVRDDGDLDEAKQTVIVAIQNLNCLNGF